MLFEVRKGFREKHLIVVLEVGHWVSPISCFEHVMDALASRYPEGSRYTPDVMCFDVFREGGVFHTIRPFDGFNDLG